MSLKHKLVHPWPDPIRGHTHTGMTLRQYYAGLALAGTPFRAKSHTAVAQDCVKLADALIAELEKSS